MYRLESIFIYPVKSLGGYSVDRCELMQKGPKGDRRYMLVDESGQHVTQRELPALSLFKVSPAESGFQIYRDGDAIQIPESVGVGTQIPCRIWDDDVHVIEAAESAGDWISRNVGRKLRLVYFPEANARPVDPDYRVAGEHVSLADGYPVLVIGQASLDNLNSQLASPIRMDRFRPNLVFSGGTAHVEDTWKDFSVGTARLRGVKPCARCEVPTVDQETGRKGKEPSATLATYRKSGHKILFGENAVVLQPGSIRVGDTIQINSLK
jgi:hypothetical protein